MVRTWKTLTPFIPHRRTWLAISGGAGALVGVLESVVVLLVFKIVLGTLIPRRMQALVGVFPDSNRASLALAFVLILITGIIHFLVAKFDSRVASTVLTRTRLDVIDTLSAASAESLENRRQGFVQESITGLPNAVSQTAEGYTRLVGAVLTLVAIVVVSAVLDIVATLIVGAIIAVSVVVVSPIRRNLRQSARKSMRQAVALGEQTAELAELSTDLRSFAVEQEAMTLLSNSAVEASKPFERSRLLLRTGNYLTGDVATMLLLVVVATLLATGDNFLAEAGSVTILAARAIGAAQMVQQSIQDIHVGKPSVMELISRIQSIRADASPVGEVAMASFGPIDMKDLGYRYQAGVDALQGVTLRIEPGESVGLVGPSGSGKSTLAHVLVRLRVPTSGTATLGGVALADIRSHDWARLVAFVPQEPKLLQATVADNIRFLRPGIDDATVLAAARSAHIADEVLAMSDGFETMLGPRGSGLSGGQKQRIAIARALVGNPECIVLDEPTSALDALSELRLQSTIAELQGRVTLIIVAHRFATLTSCSRLIVLEKGKVQRVGTPAELAAEPGFVQSVVSGMVDSA